MSAARLQQLLTLLSLLAFALLVVLSAARPVAHDDVFWHLRTAEWVLQHHEVPLVDHFTHTVNGEPWTSHEWGFALILYGPYALAGYAGLVALTALLTLLVLMLSFAHMRRYLPATRIALALPLMLIGWAALLRSGLVLRAGMLSSVFLAALCALLERLHSTRDRRWMFPITGLIWIWANCHTAVVFGLAMIGAWLVQAIVDTWRTRPAALGAALLRGATRDRAVLLLGCTALSLVNPNGIDLWTFPFRLNALLYHSDLEWDMGQFASPSLQSYPFFYVLVVAVLASALPLAKLTAAWKDARRPAIAQSLAMLFFLGMALRSNRFVIDFVVVALPFCALLLSTDVREASAADTAAVADSKLWRVLRSPWVHALNLLAIVAAFVIVRPALPQRALGMDNPTALVSFIEREHIVGRMFNYEGIGGFLGFTLRQPVYWDGRCDIFGGVATELAYTRDVGQVFAHHGIDMLVLEATYLGRFERYLTAHREQWGTVYVDDRYVVLLARIPKFQALFERWDYRTLRPFHLPSEDELLQLASDPARAARADHEAVLMLEQNQDSFLGWYVRGQLARGRGQLQAARSHLTRALGLIENSEVLYALASVARDQGHEDEARRLLARALLLMKH